MIQTTQSFDARSGPPEVHSVDALLRETYEKLRATAPKKNKEIRDECAVGLEKLDSAAGAAGVSGDDHFKALKLSCECQGCAKVVSIALDALQKLLAYGFLTGKGPDTYKEAEKGSPPRCLIDSVVECVCNCAEQADDTVQLLVVRVLLTGVTSQTCEVHGPSLMLAVKKSFQIHQDSKNAMNQRTASASLTQMLSVVAQRMELSSADMSRRSVTFEESGEASRKQAAKLQSSRELALLPPAKLLEDWTSSYLTRLVDQVVLEQRDKGGELNETVPPGKFGWCVVCRSPAAHYCVDTKDPVCGHPCKFRNLERIALVETHFGARKDEDDKEAGEDASGAAASAVAAAAAVAISPLASEGALEVAAVEGAVTGNGGCGEEAQFDAIVPPALADKALNPHHHDAVMVFSSLCKLSMKDLPAGQTDTRLVRSKRLALEMILSMLQNCGPVFRSSEPFILVLKNHLCISLIKNSVSSIPKIFGLSLQIFVMLISNFKEHLRTEIGVFIEQIFLRILESGNSTYVHKNRVLQVFSKLCTDASTALEIFLNFDCDVDEKNIFGHMIDCLSKIAQGKYTSSEHSNLIQPHQEQDLKLLALQAVVTLMGSIVDWSRRMTGDQPRREVTDGQEPGTGKSNDSDEEDAKSDATFATSGGLSNQPNNQTPASQNSSSIILEKKQRKHELQVGVNKFNMRPKRGIEHLKQNGFITDDPKDIAAFLGNPEIGLDKTAVGDYLGEDKTLNKNVLYAIVDAQDFKSMELDAAMRAFLSLFRLPGEAQKIDRMMEKFAEKYCQDNQGKFANADCAFVLSFAMIMLHTDLHNPGIRNKMTKDDFVRNNRGINDNSDLPREYLEKLYDSVASNPMSLKEDQELRDKLQSQAAQGASQKFDLFLRETESIVVKSQELMKQKMSKQKGTAYVAAQNVEHVRPMFEVACWPMLATLAVLLEMQESSVELCIEGFKHCIRIAARFDMETERDAFVSSLAKFTYLTTIKEMKQKNIECIKALLAIGLSEGNNLGPSWQHVLHCISQLERLQLIGSKSKQDFQFFYADEEAASPGGGAVAPAGGSPGAFPRTSSIAGGQVLKRRAHGLGVSALVNLGTENRMVELVNSESVMSQIDVAQIDLLFNRSTSLSSSAVVHFVTQLARVSKEELALYDQPRIFSLQKLVEVADFNMNRLRYVWARIWRVLSSHFIEVASHQNIRVCMYAIDSLRQLAMKFLEKDELSNYNFQADFLRPFGVVMEGKHVQRQVKELIVSIISNMVQGRITNIKSGWKIVFQILHTAASEPGNEAVSQVGFVVIEKVFSEHLNIFAENFHEGVKTLLAYGQCKANLAQSIRAIDFLLQAAEYLADQTKQDPPLPPPSGTQDVVAPIESSDGCGATSNAAAHWFPILRGLSTLVSDPRRDLRGAALTGVFDCMRKYGAQVFDEEAWRMIFNGVIKPLFDDIQHQLQQGVQKSDGTAASWAVAMGPPTCFSAMNEFVRLFETLLDQFIFLLDDVLKLIMSCVQHDTEAVARIGVEGFKQLLLHTGRKLPPEAWQKVTDTILELFNESMPTKLLLVDADTPGDGQLPFRQEDVVIQCVVHLLLIDTVQDIVAQHYEFIPPAGLMTLLDALQRSIDFAQKFNKQIELRQTLKRLGFMKEMRQLPGLLKQEREALSCSLKMLFQVQRDERMAESQHSVEAVGRLKDLCIAVLHNYVEKERLWQKQTEAAAVEMEREVTGLVSIISEVVLRGLKDLRTELFALFAPDLFPLLCELTTVNSREVRIMVREVLLDRVTPLVEAGSSIHEDVTDPLPAPRSTEVAVAAEPS